MSGLFRNQETLVKGDLWLLKGSNGGKEKYYVLSNDQRTLQCYKTDQKAKLLRNDSIDLTLVESPGSICIEKERSYKQTYPFKIQQAGGKKYTLASNTERNREWWINELRTVIFKLNPNRADIYKQLGYSTGEIMEHEGDTKFDVLVRNAFRERSDSLDVSGMNLEGWPELRSGSISQKLPNLKSFIADHNSFSIQLDELQSFELLEVVSLMGCGLTQFPASICTLKYLTELRLNGNNISEIPSGIRNLQRLSEFYIHNNQIYDLPPEIGYLQRMEVCNLSGNNIQFLPSDIGDCRYLSVLDISFCKLEELPPEFTNLYRLVELNISNNQIRELPEDIGKFHRLSNFNISSNRINILPISCGLLRGLSSTACTFNISGNPILVCNS
eukprot:TRINITY_DN2251_c0_g1_i8.p1 TRINITY_DN2251_c0_g1~~TRINITY_DN2251_c0_g1_i8.p1  ORF type:complete len:386 (+),score=54.93 TRINITY_DN2251_c0_g1_i8:37-1194(+)